MEKSEPPYTVDGNVHWYSLCGEEYRGSLQNKNRATKWFSNPTAGHISRGNRNSKRYMYPSVHCSTVYNSQDMEATYVLMSINGGVVHIYSGILLLMFSNSVVSDSPATPRAVVHQAPLYMGFTRQEYWSGCHFLLQAVLLRLLHSLPLSYLGSPQWNTLGHKKRIR